MKLRQTILTNWNTASFLEGWTAGLGAIVKINVNYQRNTSQ